MRCSDENQVNYANILPNNSHILSEYVLTHELLFHEG
jgi:hypothetical protein